MRKTSLLLRVRRFLYRPTLHAQGRSRSPGAESSGHLFHDTEAARPRFSCRLGAIMLGLRGSRGIKALPPRPGEALCRVGRSRANGGTLNRISAVLKQCECSPSSIMWSSRHYHGDHAGNAAG